MGNRYLIHKRSPRCCHNFAAIIYPFKQCIKKYKGEKKSSFQISGERFILSPSNASAFVWDSHQAEKWIFLSSVCLRTWGNRNLNKNLSFVLSERRFFKANWQSCLLKISENFKGFCSKSKSLEYEYLPVFFKKRENFQGFCSKPKSLEY